MKCAQAGLVVHQSQPWLCGSPDGLLKYQGSPCLLEIKCPYKRRDSILIDATEKVSFLKYVKYVDGQLTLQKSHRYYTQVQLLMYVCNVSLCFFFVHSNVHDITLLIERDEDFISTAVRGLEDFYFMWLLPALAMRHNM